MFGTQQACDVLQIDHTQAACTALLPASLLTALSQLLNCIATHSYQPVGSNSTLPLSKAAERKKPLHEQCEPSFAAPAGAAEINEAAQAAERVTSDVNQLVADLAKESHDADAVENAFEQRYRSASLQSSSHVFPPKHAVRLPSHVPVHCHHVCFLA